MTSTLNIQALQKKTFETVLLWAGEKSTFVGHMKGVGIGIGSKSMQNTSAFKEPRSSGKRLHKYSGEVVVG